MSWLWFRCKPEAVSSNGVQWLPMGQLYMNHLGSFLSLILKNRLPSLISEILSQNAQR